ncbi:NAD(P)H-dependent oxidoreductase [Flavobacterium piscinae]|uniref:NAD(P)H-dependent oxidoreductase n=1 Tax=Flavobacterium piscinae TaxID=2506424 RepID=UPI002AAB4BAB|nr:NAD(P)H-dependent oxidoreductase [Flavobacterium piscinae]
MNNEITGFPLQSTKFTNIFKQREGLVISVNEHNSNPSAFFKNVLDWLSRLDRKFLDGKKYFY